MARDREKLRKFQREWIRERRNAFFTDKQCVKCGRVERLELHHVDPTTKIAHAIWSWKEARRLEELAKCEVLCYWCHLEETREYNRELNSIISPEGCSWCNGCKQHLPIDNFWKNKTRHNGLQNQCKECRKELRNGKTKE